MSMGRIGMAWLLAAAALAVAATGFEADAGSIRLRTAALLEDGTRAVTLATVADLAGEDVRSLADIVVLQDPASAAKGLPWTEIDLKMVRRALERSGARLGPITLGGSTCLLRFAMPAGVQTSPPTVPEKPARLAEVVTDASGPGDAPAPTIKGRVALALAELFAVPLENIRLRFEDRDEELLAQTVGGRRVVVQPTSPASSSRVLVDVRVYVGDRMIENRRLRVDVEVRRRAVTLTRTVERKEKLSAHSLTESEQWMPAGVGGGSGVSGGPIESIDKAEGMVARSRLEAGSVVREGDVQPMIAVRRNEQVTIHCLRAGFEVRTRARAKSDGAPGQYIEFSLDGSAKTFLGRVEGPGVAVVDLDAHNAIAESKEEQR